jgi:aminoglycoside phosphotransferase
LATTENLELRRYAPQLQQNTGRWADLAVASWSLHWNFGREWEPAFFAAYGIEPDRIRIAYYRLLRELGP